MHPAHVSAVALAHASGASGSMSQAAAFPSHGASPFSVESALAAYHHAAAHPLAFLSSRRAATAHYYRDFPGLFATPSLLAHLSSHVSSVANNSGSQHMADATATGEFTRDLRAFECTRLYAIYFIAFVCCSTLHDCHNK